MLVLLSFVVAVVGCVCVAHATRGVAHHAFRPYPFFQHVTFEDDALDVVRDRGSRL